MAAAVGISMPRGASLPSCTRQRSSRSKGHGPGRVGFVSASSKTGFADPYDTLSVSRSASETEVRKAFRRLALQFHPDVCKGDNCKVQFYQINEAYDVSFASFFFLNQSIKN